VMVLYFDKSLETFTHIVSEMVSVALDVS